MIGIGYNERCLFDLPSKVLAIRLQDVAVVVELVELLLDEGEPGRDHHNMSQDKVSHFETMARPEQNEGSIRPSQVGRAKSPYALIW